MLPTDHIPVLLDPVLAALEPQPGDIVLDCTVGRGGHAAAIAPLVAPGGRYVGLDLDPANLEFVRARLAGAPGTEVGVDLIHRNFADARAALDELGIAGVDCVLADLGFASVHVDDASRGFSFKREGPLDMRLDPTGPVTAADLVNDLEESELADLIYRYGEERLSRRIARKIAEARRRDPILNTGRLADLCAQAYSGHARRPGSAKGRSSRGRGRIDPATRTFQALRIAVNDELGSLGRLIEAMPTLMNPGGRAAIISFHSLEDRMVKQATRRWADEGRGRLIRRKATKADDAEIAVNPRSRSARLRSFDFDAGESPAGR